MLNGHTEKVPNQLLAVLYPSDSRGRMEVRTVAVAHRGERQPPQNDRWWTSTIETISLRTRMAAVIIHTDPHVTNRHDTEQILLVSACA